MACGGVGVYRLRHSNRDTTTKEGELMNNELIATIVGELDRVKTEIENADPNSELATLEGWVAALRWVLREARGI